MIKFIMITNDPELVRWAEVAGVQRIFVDLEQLGKQERQGHLDTLISNHMIEDVTRVKQALRSAELIVRLNPLHSDSVDEIEAAIGRGADTLMLPMFRSAAEVEGFVKIVDGRVRVMPLVETRGAIEELEAIVNIAGVSEIYIGLNDLHLDMGLNFMFEPLANGLIDKLAEVIKSVGLPFGFGGIARVGEGIVPGELVLGEHLRLGSSTVILSRTFYRKSDWNSGCKASQDLEIELEKLFTVANELKLRSISQVRANHCRLQEIVKSYLDRRK